MSLSVALIRLWAFRLHLYLVVGTAMVLLLHVPGGDIVTGNEEVTMNGRTFLRPSREWSWEAYRGELSQLLTQVRTRDFPHRPHSGMFVRGKVNFWPYLANSWRNSALLFGVSVGVGSMLGLLLGSLYAFRSRLGRLFGLSAATLGLSLPDFLVVMLGQSLAIWAYWTLDVRIWYVLADPSTVKHALLPMIALAFAPMGFMARITASALDEIMLEDYIRTARAKGLPEWRVVAGHAYRNAVPRILTGLPTLMSLILSSLVVVERLTNWPGFARWILEGYYRAYLGSVDGEWIGNTPQIASIAGLIFLACFLLLEGLAHTLRILYGSRLEEVASD